MNLQEIKQLVNETFTKLNCSYLIGQTVVEWNSKMTSTAGRAWYRRYEILNSLEFSPHVFSHFGDGQQRNTVIHEVCHIVAGHLFGRKSGHGYQWKNLVRLVGETPIRCYTRPSTMMVNRRSRKQKMIESMIEYPILEL